MSTKPSFLSGNASSASSATPKQPFESVPQPMGDDEGGTLVGDENFPNRPQPMGAPKGNPESIPQGGNLPYKGAPPAPKLPFKLGK